MDTATVLFLLSLIGGFVGLAGWLSGREKKIGNEAEWRGSVNAKLDVIVGIKDDVKDIQDAIEDHAIKIAAVEQSAKSAHHRIDKMEEK